MFYGMRHKNAIKDFRVSICTIYAIIYHYVCVDYLACQSKKLSVIYKDRKYKGKSFNESMGIGIPYLLMNSFLCRGLMKNINYNFILLCRSRLLE